jgi:queuine tRNA-ribosyltransferase
MPTRNGRNGQLFTANGTMNMRNSKWADDFSPLDENGYSFADKQYSKAYLHHLFKAEEILALQIASIHNLSFYLWLVKEARRHIADGDFTTWKRVMINNLNNRI